MEKEEERKKIEDAIRKEIEEWSREGDCSLRKFQESLYKKYNLHAVSWSWKDGIGITRLFWC